MIKVNEYLIVTAITFVLAGFVACSSTEYASIPSTANPQYEVRAFEDDMYEATLNHTDILASGEFSSAAKMRDEAKSDLANGETQEEILNDVRKGRGYLNEANSVAKGRRVKAPQLLEARQMALEAGASKYAELKNALKDADSDVSKNARDLSEISAAKLASMQESYIDIERRAVIMNELGDAKAILNGAKKDGGAQSAPATYKKTEVSIKNAESVISTNVRNPTGYSISVDTANIDADYLNDVMNTIKQNKKLSEPAAIKMVSQNRQIKNLTDERADTASATAAKEWDLKNKNDELAEDIESQNSNLKAKDQDLANKDIDMLVMQKDMDSKDKDLQSANTTVEMQRALEGARLKFSADEAEAYQQGGNLVIRLKKVNFASGRSEIPKSSWASLVKVSDVAKSLNASDIKVEGHTDSVGTESVNQSISEKRATAVASYFKSNGFSDINVMSEGYGFQKPIATNKSKEGRSQNRRVDIVITPKTVQ
ncbi:OmpA family protein [bacterium]|nr:OmpA family protein [bacterium]